MENKSTQNKENKTKIHIMGKVAHLQIYNDQQWYSVNYEHNKQVTSCANHSQNIPQPMHIMADNNTIAVIDDQNNAKIWCEEHPKPINITIMIRLKAKSINIGYKQAIVCTKKGYILINWGSNKIIKVEQMQKYTLNEKHDAFFEAFMISQANLADIFYYSHQKKVQNYNKLYKIATNANQIIGYPTMEHIKLKYTIIGISIGKHHSLCWDEKGKLYSWGNNSFGFGYDDTQVQKHVSEPQHISQLSDFIISAHAATHYSLALSANGVIYQWGKKTDKNKVNEQLILLPRPLPKVSHNFVVLRCQENQFSAINSTGSLYVWGQNMNKFISYNHVSTINTDTCDKNLSEPMLVKIPAYLKIIDYAIGNNFIAFITTNQDNNLVMDEQKAYWTRRISVIKNKWFPRKNHSICIKEKSKNKQNRQRTSGGNQVNSSRINTEHIPCQVRKNTLKKQYFEMVKKEEAINYIMQNKPKKTNRNNMSQRYISTATNRTPKCKKIIAINNRLSSDNPTTNYKQFSISLKPEIMKMVTTLGFHKNNHNKKQSIFKGFALRKQVIKPYSNRLDEVLYKKKQLQEKKMMATLRKMEQNSIQYRVTRHRELMEEQQKAKNHILLKKTLQNYLIKHYIIKCLTQPLPLSRQIKIQNFGRSLKLSRLQKNIRKLFIRNRIKFSLNGMKQNNLWVFMLLQYKFHQYVKQFRYRKMQQHKQVIIQAIYLRYIKNKILTSMASISTNMKKIQKFTTWLLMVKKEKVKCLKLVWKTHVYSTLKINPHNMGCYSGAEKSNEEIMTFKNVYQQRVKDNPYLDLKYFWKNNANFESQLFSNESCLLKVVNSTQQGQNNQSYCSNTNEVKFAFQSCHFELDSKNDGKNLDKALKSAVVLPFSSDYNLFVHKSYTMDVTQAMKHHERWIHEQQVMLQKYINLIINQHAQSYCKRQRIYDRQLANFIKQKYQTFTMYRWRYIIEYNQMVRTHSKIKKQSQLFRLLKIVNAENLLLQDCIPQKHTILNLALQKADAPLKPSNNIVFGVKEFKKYFKLYYDQLNHKFHHFKRIIGH